MPQVPYRFILEVESVTSDSPLVAWYLFLKCKVVSFFEHEPVKFFSSFPKLHYEYDIRY